MDALKLLGASDLLLLNFLRLNILFILVSTEH